MVLLTDQASYGFSQGVEVGIRGKFSWFEHQEFRKADGSFADLIAAQNGNDSLQYSFGSAAQEQGHGRLVTGNYFSFLGVSAELGRTFTQSDDELNHTAPVVMVSDSFWRRRLGGSPDVLGKTIRVGHAELTIVGVTTPDFYGERTGESTELFIRMQLEPQI